MLSTIFHSPVRALNTTWRPSASVDVLREEFDRLFNGAESSTNVVGPAVDVRSNGEGVTVTAELPGFKSEEIDVLVDRGLLILTTSREEEKTDDTETYYRRERRSGKLERHIKLPFRVEVGEVAASYRDGVLTVNLPRTPEERVKKIEVKST